MDARAQELRRLAAWLRAAGAARQGGDPASAGVLEAEAVAALERMAREHEAIAGTPDGPLDDGMQTDPLRVPQVGPDYMDDLKRRMATAGIKAAQLARAAGKSPAQVSRWMHGMVPSPANMAELESAFHRLLDAQTP